MSHFKRAEIVVDLAAIRHNVATLKARLEPGVKFMAVVKADGYGHGRAEVGRAAREAGADWLGVATLDEALLIRTAGDRGPLLCWLTVPGEDYTAALEGDIDLSAYSVAELDEIEQAARSTGIAARVQLKIDTGLSRGGARREDWPALVERARKGEEAGWWTVTGIWSHLACADEPAHPANDLQEQAFREAVEIARQAGLRPELCHLANSAATVLRPSIHFDLVRCGIAIYGLDPAPGASPSDLDLIPAMTVRAQVAMVKRIQAGDSVSYSWLWTADRPTTLGLFPAGYGEGVPRNAGTLGVDAEVGLNGARHPVRGRICMDQFAFDLGDTQASPGDEVVLFGPPAADGTRPTAQDWAEACGTINYEIVTRIGGRLERVYLDSERDA